MKYLLGISMLFLTSFSTEINPTPLSKDNVYAAIVAADIKYPDLVFAQALLESGDFKSKLTRTNNNIFGMKLSKYRPTTAIGKSKYGYAKYETWIKSVEDYKIWQDYTIAKYKLTTKKEYVYYVSKRYSETGDYIQRTYKRLRDNYHIIEKYNENKVLQEARDTTGYRLAAQNLEKL